MDSDTWLISSRKGEKNPWGFLLCGSSGATPVLPPITGVVARLVSPALVLSLCPVLSFRDPPVQSLATGGRRGWRRMGFPYLSLLHPVGLPLFPVVSGIPRSLPLSCKVPAEQNAGTVCRGQQGFWIWGNIWVWRGQEWGSPSLSFEVPPLLLFPLCRPCRRVKVSQDKAPSWSTSTVFNLSITKGLNGISHRYFVIWTQETCADLFAVVDPRVKPWVEFNLDSPYSLQNKTKFKLLVILHTSTAH